MKNEFKVSVVVCTYNGAEKINKCVNSLLAQDFDINFEIIVVIDGSSDQTRQIINNNKKVRIIEHEINMGISTSRNTGLMNTRSRYIAFIDDDCIAEKSWLKNMVKTIEGNNSLGVGGKVLPAELITLSQKYMFQMGYGQPSSLVFNHNSTIFGRFIAYIKNELSKSKGITNTENDVYEIYGANCIFNTNYLREVGGYSTLFSAFEDSDICAKLHKEYPNMKFRYNPDAIVWHDYTKSYVEYLRKIFKRQSDNLIYHKSIGKIPPIYPLPILILLLISGSVIFTSLSLVQMIIASLLYPVVLYFWWVVRALYAASLTPIIFSYMQFLDETVRLFGMLIAFLNNYRKQVIR